MSGSLSTEKNSNFKKQFIKATIGLALAAGVAYAATHQSEIKETVNDVASKISSCIPTND